MHYADTLITAGYIIPVVPDGAILRNHTLVIQQGRIAAVLPSERALHQYHSNHCLDLQHHALIPGLINAHTHAAMNLLRGMGSDLSLMDWLQNHIWPAEQRWVNEAFVTDGTRHAIAEMLRGGVTCFNDMYYFPDAVARVSAEIGMRACVGLIVLDFPTVYAQTANDYISKGLALHDKYRDDSLIRTVFAPHAPYTVSDGPLKRIHIYSNELDLGVHTHLHETAAEIEHSLLTYGVRPIQRLADLGLLNPALQATHMTQLEPKEFDLLAEAGVNVLHCPESNLKLASGFCPVNKLMKHGVNVALGTDGAASNDDLDMFSEMRTAALLAKAVAQDATALPAKDALRMATLNGAIALGLSEETGSLEVGKSADITAIDLSSIESVPHYDPISQIVYATGRDKVTDVWVAGRHLLKQRQLTTIDEVNLLNTITAWNAKIGQSDRLHLETS